MSSLTPQAERALCALLTQELLNEQADRHHEEQALMRHAHLSSRPEYITPANPYAPLRFDAHIPCLPDWLTSVDDFDAFDYH